jgi:hypothetical protein
MYWAGMQVVTPARLKPRGHGDSYETHAPRHYYAKFTAYTNLMLRLFRVSTHASRAAQSRNKAHCTCVLDASSYN